MKYTLGLDMGVASLGWAVLSEEDQFIDSGVRIFPAGIDNFNSSKEKHPNQDRRLARGMRRRIRRKAERKKNIASALQSIGWMPTANPALHEWFQADVYHLRHRALSEKISLLELGRIIYHLNQRRGFLSLRKTEAEGDKEAQGMLGDISELEKKIKKSGALTLGNYLYQLYQKDGITKRLRNRQFSRKMLYHEFCEIWTEQKKHHPNDLDDSLRHGTHGPLPEGTEIKTVTPITNKDNQSLLEKFGLEGMTFFQRRVYWPAGSIGKCELETDQFRAPIADRRFQEFRLLQEVNNLKITDYSHPGSPLNRPLHREEQLAAIKYLSGKDRPKIDALKKHLCNSKLLPDFPTRPAQVTFNLENGGRTAVAGTPTDAKLKSAKGLGKEWLKFPEGTKNQIVEALTLPAATDEDIREGLEKIDVLTNPQVDRLLSVSLAPGYGHLSITALKKLLVPMLEGKLYMHKEVEKCALAAAGYERPDQRSRFSGNKIPEKLDLFEQVSTQPTTKQLHANPQLAEIFDAQQSAINNPVVKRSLTELRKVVNALIRKYGKPARIHLEMARSLKMSPRQRSDYEKKTRGFEKERAAATKELEEHNIIPNRDSLQIYRLWTEQQKQCPYCDNLISQTQLFSGSGEIDIDHIYPFSRSADNSMANKVLCHRKCNANKGNKTPREWLETSNPETYEAMIQRTKSLPSNKRKRFYAEEIPDGFVNRDLNDTAWMAKAARQYLARIMPALHDVQGTKGAHTAILRDHWQLHSLLRNDGVDLKNRDDHRHHALDAILIALCDQRRIKALLANHQFQLNDKPAKEEGKKIYRLTNSGSAIDLPWPEFRTCVEESLNEIWVSHRSNRKISGPLHKKTNYGKTQDGLLVVRKPIQSLSKKDVAGIRDPHIAKIIQTHIQENGGDPTCLKNLTDENPLCIPSRDAKVEGTPIKKVRTAIPYAHLTIRKGTSHETYVQSESTHHMCIFALGDGSYHFQPTTMLEMAERMTENRRLKKQKRPELPLIRTAPPANHPEAEFLMHLCSDDTILAKIDGIDQLYVYKGAPVTSLQAKFVYHCDARKNNEKHPETGKAVSILRTCRPNTFEQNFPEACKVEVLPNGELRPC